MIPDKIYIRHYWMPGELDDEWRLKPVEDEQCEEYIRKDLLLEWAKEEQAKCSSETHPYAMFMNVVIEKLNSL